MTDEQALQAIRRVLGKALFGEEATKGKEFYIPMNTDSKTQFFGIYLRDYVFFLPSLVVIVSLFLLNIHPLVQFFIDFILLTITFCLITIRPLRPEIQAWKHIQWFFQFEQRQKRFLYRKRGVR
jgi:hypothetical protein